MRNKSFVETPIADIDIFLVALTVDNILKLLLDMCLISYVHVLEILYRP
jgi:hypothetical protein